MGEAFKRMRAATFHHQNHRPYQALINRDLLRASRGTETRFEVQTRLTDTTSGLVEGSHCIVRETDGEYHVVHGNIVVSHLPVEARETISAYVRVTPSLNGIIPCRVSRVGAFGGVSLELDTREVDDGSQ